MKKTILSLLLFLSVVFLVGCGGASNSLDKNDANIHVPLDYEYTDVITADSFSKAVAYDKMNKIISNSKMYVRTSGAGVSTSGVGIISVDKKTGEGIGACKTTITSTSRISGYNGSSMTYIRGKKSYTDFDYTLFSNYNGTKTSRIAGKYYMDIPVKDEKGVGSFFGDNAAENAYLTDPFEILALLKESGFITTEDNTFKKARIDGYAYYKVTFGTMINQMFGNSKTEITVKMRGGTIVGVSTRAEYLVSDNMKCIFAVDLVAFSSNLDVPTEFIGYDMSFDEYMNYLSQSMMSMVR